MSAPRVVVMGVSAAGKSTVGRGLAAALGVPFVDADDLHPPANVAKMAAGQPLTDADRMPWLAVVGATLDEAEEGMVIACSALKRRYRDAIRADARGTVFVELTGSPELLAERAASRKGHFMPPSLLASQLATLEPLQADETGVPVDVAQTPEQIVAEAAEWMAARAARP